MSAGKIISILLLVAGIIVTSIGGFIIVAILIEGEVDYYHLNLPPRIIQLIIGIACIGTSIYISRKDKNKS